MTRTQRFFRTAVWLSLSAMVIRAVGVLYHRCLTSVIGAVGVGEITLVLSVYGFAVTLASSGIHLAVTRTVAEAGARGAHTHMYAARRRGMLWGTVLGCSAAALLYLLAPWIAKTWLSDQAAVLPLRLLAFSLPPLSFSTVCGGIFTAERRAARGAFIGLCGNLIRIGGALLLLRALYLPGICSAATVVAAAALLSELFCAAVSAALLPRPRKASDPPYPIDDDRPAQQRYFLHILLPVLAAACVRSGLQTVQQLLIPIGLRRAGMTDSAALAVYGTVHGMVFPILLFPAALLYSCTSLLIPEVSAMRASQNTAGIRCTATRVLHMTLGFSVLVAGILYYHADTLGALLYDSTDAGRWLRLLAPLVPLMYTDSAVDALLKSLDAQTASMRFNLYDAAFCVLAACTLLPTLGGAGYLLLLYASEAFNLTLSFRCLYTHLQIRPPVWRWVLSPIISVAGAVTASHLLISGSRIAFRYPISALASESTLAIGLFLILWYLLGGYDGQRARRLLYAMLPLGSHQQKRNAHPHRHEGNPSHSRIRTQ
ncbi:MAG: oligosaccharide flippase family protein [Clostridia bacterium]|nr:oligosaccharide flippase family protein [Clostridia bacterium]